MKELRFILQTLGIIFIVFNLVSLFIGKGPGEAETAFLIGWYIAKFIFFFFGICLLMIAGRIKKKLNKKEAHTLIESLPG